MACYVRCIGKTRDHHRSQGRGSVCGRARFDDPRLQGRDGRRYGPLPATWAKYRGLYQHGEKAVLSYTVGTTNVLELPAVTAAGAEPLVRGDVPVHQELRR